MTIVEYVKLGETDPQVDKEVDDIFWESQKRTGFCY